MNATKMLTTKLMLMLLVLISHELLLLQSLPMSMLIMALSPFDKRTSSGLFSVFTYYEDSITLGRWEVLQFGARKIRTVALRFRKRPLFPLTHHHCLVDVFIAFAISVITIVAVLVIAVIAMVVCSCSCHCCCRCYCCCCLCCCFRFQNYLIS